MIQYRTINNDIAGFLGLALSHPMFYFVAVCSKCIPCGQVAFKVNLISALAGAMAVANLYALVWALTGRGVPAIVAAVTLALSHTFWQHACMAETYTLWSALFTLELLMLVQYTKTQRVGYLYWLGLLNGLAAAVHMLAVIALAVYIVWVLLLWRRRCVAASQVAFMAALWIAGCLPYEALCVRDALARGDLWSTLCSALFGNQWRGQVLNASVSGRLVTENLLLWALNFPTPNGVLALVGLLALIKALRKAGPAWVILALTTLYLAFAFRYTVADRYAFFIPFYILVSVLLGLGADAALRRFPRPSLAYAMIVAAFLPVAFYAAAPGIARAAGLDLHTRGDVPYRDDLQFFLTPWKTGCVGPQRFAAEALTSVAPGAVIYADLTCVGPLLVTQQEGALRPDVAIVSTAVHSPSSPPFSAVTLPTLLERRPVYVVSKRRGYCPVFLLEGYDLTRAGLLWQVRTRIGEENPCW